MIHWGFAEPAGSARPRRSQAATGQICRHCFPTVDVSAQAIAEAQELVTVLDEFIRLTEREHLSHSAAARLLGRHPSLFSGPDSPLARYQRGGFAALLREARQAPAATDLTREIEALP